MTAEQIIKRAETLQQARSGLDSHLQQIRDVMYPSALAFNRQETPGARNRRHIYDNTAEYALELLAAGLHGLLTNPYILWFGLRARRRELNRIRNCKIWLDQARDVMVDVMNAPAAGFAPNQHKKYLEAGAFGTGCQFIAELPGRGPLYQTRPLAECSISEGSDGRVDTVYRTFRPTARQALQEFGNRAGPKVCVAAIDPKRCDDRFTFTHATQPRRERDATLMGNRAMPWQSVYVNHDEKHIIRDSGFPEFPWVCPRMETREDEHYGRGSGMRALSDTLTLQESVRLTIRAAGRAVAPALMAADEGVFSDIDMSEDAINFVAPHLMQSGRGDPIRPIQTGANAPIGEDFNDGLRKRIERAFYNDLLQQFRDPRMVATMVIKISEETRMVLGPIVSRFEVEDAGPMIRRTLAILLRAGAIPPPPDELRGEPLEVDYEGPIAKSMRQSEVRAVSNLSEIMAPFSPQFPEVWDNVDMDEVMILSADALGVPASVMRDPREVAKIRAGRQQAQAEQLERQQALEETETVAKAAPMLMPIQGGRAA